MKDRPKQAFISGQKGFGDCEYGFFYHIQELGFKGLGFRQSWIWVFIAKNGESFAISYFVIVEFFTFDTFTLLSFHFAR